MHPPFNIELPSINHFRQLRPNKSADCAQKLPHATPSYLRGLVMHILRHGRQLVDLFEGADSPGGAVSRGFGDSD